MDDFIFYPTHCSVNIVNIENEVFDGKKIDFYVINFEQDRLLLRVPKEKAEELGLRRTSSKDRIKEAINALKTPRRASTLMWSRRAEEYQLKINSGDPVQLAEVLREITKLSKKYKLPVANAFHAGDGNLHPIIMFDANDKTSLEKTEKFGEDIFKLCVKV